MKLNTNHTAQVQGREFETKFARKIGGTTVKGSGSLWYAKLDVGANSFIFSLKHTTKKSFALTVPLMQETERSVSGLGGSGLGTVPALVTHIEGETYVTLQVEDFLRIVKSDDYKIPMTKSEVKSATARIPQLLRQSEAE